VIIEQTVTPPKHIKVQGNKIRFRLAQQLIWAVVIANIAILFPVFLYYVFIQAKWPGATYGGHSHTVLYLKPAWDGLFSYQGWAADRHDIRNVYEGAFAALFGGTVLAASWKKASGKTAPGWYLLIAPLLVIVVAFPLVVGGVAFLNHGAPYLWHAWLGPRRVGNPVHLQGRWSWLGTYLSGFPWQPFLVGLVTGRVVRRVWAPAGNTIQAHFIGRQVDLARDTGDSRHLPHWPLPPVTRERAWWMWEVNAPVPDRARSIRWAVVLTALAFAAADAYGGYVKYVIARGH